MGLLGRLDLGLFAGLLSLVAGCSSVNVGLGHRKVSGGYGPYRVDRMIPFVRVQGERNLVGNLDGYVRGDLTCGKVDARPESLHGFADGHFISLGSGFSYHLTPDFSLNFGGELFHADIDMNFDGFGIKKTIPDSISGWGLNFGATFERPIEEKIYWFISGGYNLANTLTEKCGVDFSGPEVIVGIGGRF